MNETNVPLSRWEEFSASVLSRSKSEKQRTDMQIAFLSGFVAATLAADDLSTLCRGNPSLGARALKAMETDAISTLLGVMIDRADPPEKPSGAPTQ